MNSPTSVPRKSSEKTKIWDDPIVREVRDARHRLAARFDNDLQRVADDLMLRQASHGSRLNARQQEGHGRPARSA
jgi:hypothetical protein